VNIPSDGRNYLDFALLTPNVTPSTGVGSGLNLSGGRARSNNVTADGFSNNNQAINGVRVLFSQEAVREFQILANSYAAEYGNASGGVINVVSQSGTNELNGSLFGFFRNDTLRTKAFFDRYRRYGQDGQPIGDPLDR